jgi:hypothetical protein
LLEANPLAAEALLDLLRSIDIDDLAEALVQESLAYGVLQGSPEHADWLGRQSATSPILESGNVGLTREGDVIHILRDRPHADNAIDRWVGRRRTALMILSVRRISASVALHWGLIDAIIEDTPARAAEGAR